MTKNIIPYLFVALCFKALSAATTVNVTSIEQLDSMALFSFSAFGDNNGRSSYTYRGGSILGKNYGDPNNQALGMYHLEAFVEANDRFCLGVGDHGQGGREHWFDVNENVPFWHNNFYPVVGDNCNETSYGSNNGVTADQAVWGRGWVMFEALNNFFNREIYSGGNLIEKIEFRQPGSQIYSHQAKGNSTRVLYDDQLVDYYAKRVEGPFTFHIIGLNIPDPGVFHPRSVNFMVSKLNEIGVMKTDYDVVIVNAQRANWVSWAENNNQESSDVVGTAALSPANRDLLFTVADLILCGDDHVYRRQNNYDGTYGNNGAIWMNIGMPAYNTGAARGYLNFHMFDNPPRFTVQYIVTEDKSWYEFTGSRMLHVQSYANSGSSHHPDTMKPYLKYINGTFGLVDWQNFIIDGDPPADDPVVNFVTPSGNIYVSEGSDLEVEVSVTDNDPIQSVTLYKDNQLVRAETDSPYTWNGSGQTDAALTNLQAGTFTLRAVALDTDNDDGEASITVTVLEPGQIPPVYVNFQPSSAPVPSGYIADASEVFGDRGNGYNYGWGAAFNGTRDRNNHADQRFDTLNHTQQNGADHYWEIELPNGDYDVTIVAGDPSFDDSIIDFVAEEGTANQVTVVSGVAAGVNFITGTQRVTISDGRLTIGNGATASNNKICYIDIVYVAPNLPPSWTDDNMILTNAVEGQAYNFDLATNATDPENNTLQFSLVSGTANWVSVSSSGIVSGTPGSANVGFNVITVSVSDGTNTPVNGIFTINVDAGSSPYETWKLINGITDDNADDDSDGIINILEFALGGDPQSAASGDEPVVVKNGSNFDFEFKREEASVTYTIEKSTDLINWTDHMTVTDVHGTVGTTATVPVPDTEMSSGKLFLRLKIEN